MAMEAHLHGPVFDGRARRLMRAYTDDVVDDVALQYGITVVDELKRVVRNPTPYYWTRIQVDRVGTDRVVTDGGVVYGPWLAGVSSRNKTTRFKGYQHWRRATERLRRRTPAIGARLFRVCKPRLEGQG